MTIKKFEGSFQGQDLKIAIVSSRFNDFITSKLYEGAYSALVKHGVEEENIVSTWVPGAFELPLAAKKLLDYHPLDAVICLGAVIRGATTHYDYVCSECAKGISKVSLESGKPVLFGVLTTETIEQAIERAGTKAGNKGWDCALAAIEMANLTRLIESPRK